MVCRQEIISGSGVTPLGPGEPGGVLPPGVVPNTFLQWNGVLWVPSSWTLPEEALAGNVGEVLTAAGVNTSDWAPPPVLPVTTAYHYAYGTQQVNAGTQALFPFFSTFAATVGIATAMGAIAQFDGTLRNLYVTHGTPVAEADSITYTILVNNIATGLSVTLATAAAGPASNLVNTVTVFAGDKITVRTTGGTANRPIVPRLQFILDASTLPPAGPLAIMGAATHAWWRSDVVTLSGLSVTAWPDQSGNGRDLVQATGTAQPTFVAAGGPNGTPSILFDGTTDVLVNATIDRVAPSSAAPTFVWTVLRQVTWTSTRRLWGFGTSNLTMTAIQNSATPQIAQADTAIVNSNAGLPVNTYGRGEFYFSGSTNDYTKLIATIVTGASAGALNPAPGFKLGASGATTLFSNIEVCEVAIFDVLPTPAQLAALDAYVTNRYGPGLV